MKNILHTEPLIEAMALCAITDEIMSSETDRAITYSNDGSSMSRVGLYVVQFPTINGVQRSFPTLAIFTESRESLKDLELTTVYILSAASFHKYSEQGILKKISFMMTDSTAHNLKVIWQVEEELNVDHIPKTLLCNVHLLMMFHEKIKELCQAIHNSFGNTKVIKFLLVAVDFKNESFVIK